METYLFLDKQFFWVIKQMLRQHNIHALKIVLFNWTWNNIFGLYFVAWLMEVLTDRSPDNQGSTVVNLNFYFAGTLTFRLEDLKRTRPHFRLILIWKTLILLSFSTGLQVHVASTLLFYIREQKLILIWAGLLMSSMSICHYSFINQLI